MNKDYVVIVDPYSSACLLPRDFNAAGFDCIAVHSQETIPSNYAGSFHAQDFVAETVFNDVESCAHFLKEYAPVAVLAGAESGVQKADLLTHHLALSSNDFALSLARRDKFEMQEAIAKQGIRAIKQLKTSQFDEIEPWLKSNNIQEFIIKPLASAGSEGVSKCSNLDEARKSFDSILHSEDMFMQLNQAVLVQEFIHGSEYVVDTVSCDGKSFVTNLCRYHKCQANGSDVVYREMEFLHPEDESLQEIIEYNQGVLDALGITVGPAHSEIMLSPDGPVLIEVGARIHGGYTPRTVQNFSSVSQLDLTVDAFTNHSRFKERTSQPPTFHKKALVQFFISTEEGKVEDVNGKEQLSKLDSYFDSVWGIAPQSKVSKTVDLFTSPGWVVLMNESANALNRDKQAAIDLEENHELYRLSSV
ncbi:ATP-grasp domain-containing protein [Vibrio sp. vnigr-6D03]|uniref:ATP-grasp domain-containing protein n=1 Tax=Vibrio sp. vnigr-6D03 TaxID=2058088 RepID=UPI0015E0A99B|nr:ATP-grasp domain-containing protein [Vibrio sp. vnigr-6D03]